MKNKNLPNFLCIGSQKAGTTTLHNILKQHPNIYLPESKEAHYFDIDENYKKGREWWLETFFASYENEKIIGAITPEYLYYEDVPQRIVNTLGNTIKIIIILRNPVDRAYSQYLMSRRRGREELSFEEAIAIEKERITKGDFEKRHFSYISRSTYYTQLKRYFELFQKENILVLKFEDDLIKNRKKTIERVLEFLDVKDIPLITVIKSNKATLPRFPKLSKLMYQDGVIKKILRPFIKSSKIKTSIGHFINKMNQTNSNIPKLTVDEKKKYLTKYFLEDIKLTEELLNINFSCWYNE